MGTHGKRKRILPRRVGRLGCAGLTALFLTAFLLPSNVAQASTTFTVNSTDDVSGACTLVHCSLREAIDAANTNPGAAAIAFAIIGVPPFTIQPMSPLPQITDPVTIDGTSQPGFSGNPIIELNGASAGSASGLAIGADNSVIKGLVVNGFSDSGVRIVGAHNVLSGNYIGTDVTGTVALGNTSCGVEIDGSNNTIGGTTSAARNVISGTIFGDCFGAGVSVDAGTGNTIEGNYIGTDVTGTVALGNAVYGVAVASNNTVGGTTFGARNIISGNGLGGVFAGGTGNTIEGNYIGTDVSGTAAIGNPEAGVFIGGDNNMIGGTTPGARNIISSNGEGVFVGGGPGNTVEGNYIGTDVTGTAVLGNAPGDGVAVGGCCGATGNNNTIGGTTPGARNIISGNAGAGVTLHAGGNMVEGNFIGTDATGTAALGNGVGVVVGKVENSIIGGTAPAARNVISGNGYEGVEIDGFGNVVEGNYIGTDATGTAALGNGNLGPVDALGGFGGGVFVGGSNNTIGGTTSGARNVISGNTANTDGIFGVVTGGSTNTVEGNYIGTDVTGTAALANGGLCFCGFGGGVFAGGSNNTIGGTTSDARNVISGNLANGLVIGGDGENANVVEGNYIGTDATGTAALGNGDGVHMGGFNNVIGGIMPGAANTIAFNEENGVAVDFGTGNAIQRNSIFSNGGLGIDLGGDGVTLNDPGDADSGPNKLQNFPVLRPVTSNGGGTTIQGTLNSTSKTTFTLEFFSNPTCDPSGFGQGKTFIGSTSVTTNAKGNANFAVHFPTTIPTGSVVTATATDPGGNTSEFSKCARLK
jgi:CSLREA domain-containing protein